MPAAVFPANQRKLRIVMHKALYVTCAVVTVVLSLPAWAGKVDTWRQNSTVSPE